MLKNLLCFIIALSLSLMVIDKGIAVDTSEFTRIFDSLNAAAKEGNANKILSFMPAKQQKEIKKDIAKKENREAFLLFSKANIPDSYEVQRVEVAQGHKSAKLFLLCQFSAMPEVKRDSKMRMEEVVNFVKEGNSWKIDNIMPLGDPDKIKRSNDLSCNYDNANTDSEADIGGRIVKTEFLPTHTVVMLRVMDEEVAICLPKKQVLLDAEVSLSDLDPWVNHEFWGHWHKTDKLKFYAKGGKRIQD